MSRALQKLKRLELMQQDGIDRGQYLAHRPQSVPGAPTTVSTSCLNCGLYLAHRPTNEVNTSKIERGQYLTHDSVQYLAH